MATAAKSKLRKVTAPAAGKGGKKAPPPAQPTAQPTAQPPAKPTAKPIAKGKARARPPRSSPPAEVELDADTLEFIAAIQQYRLVQSRPFPSWSEVLHVLRGLGYRKSV